ncbi:MAG: hypothetical protein LBR83_00665 [Clostridiales bacterium]|jgi:hypothetical protein|nr:hypothetical protein [Clostridiales bacterium]
MKKFLSLLLAAVMVFSVTAIVPASEAGATYALEEALPGATEQGPEWNYLARVDEGEWQALYYTAQWGDNWQYSETPDGDGIYFSLYLSEGKAIAYPGWMDGQRYSIAARYTAPKKGTVTIAPWRHMLSTYGDIYLDDEGAWVIKPKEEGGITAVITKNGEELYRGDSSPTEVVGSEAITVDVAKGDEIWFIVEPHEDAEGDVLINDLSVTYGEEARPSADILLNLPVSYGGEGIYSLHDTFMSAEEQGSEWFYMQRLGDGDWAELNYYPEWGANWQASPNPDEDAIYYSLFDWNGVGAQAGYDILSNEPYEIAAAFKAPETGTLRIAPWRHILFSNCDFQSGTIVYEPYEGNTYAAEIRKNDETLYFTRLSGGMQTSEELSVEVEEGDMIYFIMRPMELVDVNSETPTVRMDDIMVTYEDVSFDGSFEVMAPVSAEELETPASEPGDPKP